MTATMDNAELLARMLSAYNSGDVDGVVADAAPDVEYVMGARSIRLVGPDGWRSAVAMMATGVPDRRMEVTRQALDGDVAMVEWILEGTSSGQVPQFPPAGEPFHMEGCSVISFGNGRIVRFRDYVG